MTKPPEPPSTAQVLSDQRQANEQLVLTNLDTLEKLNNLEARAIAGERRIELQITQHLADRKELKNANRLATLGRLTASIVHELGTPLAVIQVRAQMMAAGEVPQNELSADAAIILEQTRRMTQMIREVLELATPQGEATNTPLELTEVGRRTVALLAPLTRKRNVKLVFVTDGLPLWVLADSSQLLQVLSNLIINAAQSMNHPGIVELRLQRRRACPPNGTEAEYGAFDVIDHGVGMDDGALEHIFEPFYTTKGDGGGTGLGLAVSKRIANEHGGFIGVTSEVGVGSCFTLYLPPIEAPRPTPPLSKV